MRSTVVSRLTDVLVPGGTAGPRAAIEAKKNNARVFLILKGIYGSGGCSLGPSVASGIGPWSDSKDHHRKKATIRTKTTSTGSNTRERGMKISTISVKSPCLKPEVVAK